MCAGALLPAQEAAEEELTCSQRRAQKSGANTDNHVMQLFLFWVGECNFVLLGQRYECIYDGCHTFTP